MKTIKRWIKNLKWLLNHPPLNVKSTNEDHACDFCKRDNAGWIKYYGTDNTMYICYDCICKAFHKILDEK